MYYSKQLRKLIFGSKMQKKIKKTTILCVMNLKSPASQIIETATTY